MDLPEKNREVPLSNTAHARNLLLRNCSKKIGEAKEPLQSLAWVWASLYPRTFKNLNIRGIRVS